jgi:hypothetical protein
VKKVQGVRGLYVILGYVLNISGIGEDEVSDERC